jgi:hypothetical protein
MDAVSLLKSIRGHIYFIITYIYILIKTINKLFEFPAFMFGVIIGHHRFNFYIFIDIVYMLSSKT